MKLLFFIVASIFLFVGAENGCGTDWATANSQCKGQGCSSNDDCSSGEYCYASIAGCSGSSVPSTPSGSGSGSTVRCGTSWAAANDACGSSCSTNSDCSSGQSCYNALKACSGSSSSGGSTTPSTPSGGSSTLGCSTTHTVTNADLQAIMQSSADFTTFVAPLNRALSQYSMNCPQRIAVFLSQVRHETAGLTIFHQPLDNGGGSLHMTPSNWLPACQAVSKVSQAFQSWGSSVGISCSSCSCVAALAADPGGASTTSAAKTIFADPDVAFLTGTWWFASGAAEPSIFGWKGCGDLRSDSDVGLGAAGSSDCRHTGFYQVTCCIFWTISGSAGLQQRINYYNVALNVAQGWTSSNAEVEAQNDYELGDNKNVMILGIACGVGGLIILVLLAIIVVMSRRISRVESV